MLSGLRGEDSIAELCRKLGIAQSLYYSWSKEFLEAGTKRLAGDTKRLAGDTARQASTGEVKDLRAEALALKELVADLSLENRLLKNMRGGTAWSAIGPRTMACGTPRMGYAAAETLEIIRLVEQSHLPVRRTLARIGIPPTTFYHPLLRFEAKPLPVAWQGMPACPRRGQRDDRFVEHGPERLEDRSCRPSRVWNRLPEAVRDQIVDLALEEPELSPCELAVRCTDREKYFASEASVYRLLKPHDLITSPAYIWQQ